MGSVLTPSLSDAGESHARTSVEREAGCHRFDVHQELRDPTLFFLYEVYTDEAALQAHRDLEHYKSFRADATEQFREDDWISQNNSYDGKIRFGISGWKPMGSAALAKIPEDFPVVPRAGGARRLA